MLLIRIYYFIFFLVGINMCVNAAELRVRQTDCVISGGGPAGLMLAYLLSRQGIDVTVLEKHKDFLRDFRGDTVHPSTLELFKELGLLDEFLKCPHQKTECVAINFEGKHYNVVDFRMLSSTCNFIAMMPQWNFLDFVAEEASKFPNFHLLKSTASKNFIKENGKISGIIASDATGELEIHAKLVVAADGRKSLLREVSGLELVDLGAPLDVFWMRLPKCPNEQQAQSGAVISSQGFLVKINREQYWQCAMLFPKGEAEKIRSQGLEQFRQQLTLIDPSLEEATETLSSWDDVKLLDVQVNYLKQWWLPGFLSIGDAAHAMSPVGGVGINLAIQDAVAAARVIAKPLKDGTIKDKHLAKVQKRRAWAARVTQKAQVSAHNNFLYPILTGI